MKPMTYKKALLPVLMISLLTACGGGGGGGSENPTPTPTPTPKSTVTVNLMTQAPQAILNTKSAFYEVELAVAEPKALMIAAQNNASALKINHKYFVPALEDVGINHQQLNTVNPCDIGVSMVAGERCVDRLEFNRTDAKADDQALNYRGKVVYQTTAGNVEVPLELNFMPETAKEFTDSFEIAGISSITAGTQFTALLTNPYEKSFQNPRVIFPEVIKPYITQMDHIKSLDNGQSKALHFKVENSSAALAALKAWKQLYNEGGIGAEIYYDSANSAQAKYNRQPKIITSTTETTNEVVTIAKDELTTEITIVNNGTEAITQISADLSDQAFAGVVAIDLSDCEQQLPLAVGSSCRAVITLDPAISEQDKAALQALKVSINTSPESVLEPLVVPVSVDTDTSIAIKQATLLKFSSNLIEIKNTGNRNWIPSSDLSDYRIADGEGNDVTADFDIQTPLANSCLATDSVAPNATCQVKVVPKTNASVDKDYFLTIAKGNHRTSALALPKVSLTGMQVDPENSNAVVKGEDVSLFISVAPATAKTLKSADFYAITPNVVHTQDTSVANHCEAGKTVSSADPCLLKLDIKAADIPAGASFNPVVTMHWQTGGSSSSEPINIDVIDPADPEAPVEKLADLSLLADGSSAFHVNKQGLQVRIDNTSGKKLSQVRVKVDASSWLNNYLDLSKETTLSIANSEVATLTIPLKAGVSLSAWQTAVLSNNAALADNPTNKGVFVVANNALGQFAGVVENNLSPYFAGLKQMHQMRFDQPGVQTIEVKNPTAVGYTINLDSTHLPQGTNLVPENSKTGSLPICSDGMTLSAKSSCALEVIAGAGAYQTLSDSLNIHLLSQDQQQSINSDLVVTFTVDYIDNLSLSSDSTSISVPYENSHVYNLRVNNPETTMQWKPSTNLADYRLITPDATGLQLVEATDLQKSCLNGNLVASGGYCLIGVEVKDTATVGNNLGLQINRSYPGNLAQDLTSVSGTVTTVDHGQASVALKHNGVENPVVIDKGETFEVEITPSDDWTGIDNNQVYTISSTDPLVSIEGSNQCILDLNTKLPCSVTLKAAETITSGIYVIDLTASTEATMPLNITSLLVNIKYLKKWSVLSINHRASCGVDEDGQAYCWGWNTDGTLGDGTYMTKTSPTLVNTDNLTDPKWITISTNAYTSCGLDINGKAYCWGGNKDGQLGNGTTEDSNIPVAVDTAGVLKDKTLIDIQSVDSTIYALSADGEVYGWGVGDNGALGNGTYSDSPYPVKVGTNGVMRDKKIKKIITRYQGACAIDIDNVIYCWGWNSGGVIDQSFINKSRPVIFDTSFLPAGRSLKQLSLRIFHACALDDLGQAYCWGRNTYGLVGNGTMSERSAPVAVDTSGVLKGKTLKQISVGRFLTCAIDTTGQPYCWGSNSYGGLGIGSTDSTPRTTPVAVDVSGVLKDKKIVSIHTQTYGACVFDEHNKAYCWGANSYGSLGDGTTNHAYSPVAVLPPPQD